MCRAKRLYWPLALLFLRVPVAFGQPQDVSPPVQAQQSGLPLLTEFLLNPGDRPYAYRYTVDADGPQRLVAAWGTTVDIAMAVESPGEAPIVNRGNPAEVRFDAKRGVDYTIRLGASSHLPVATVGVLYGGPQAATTLQVVTVQPGAAMAERSPVVLEGLAAEALSAATAPVSRQLALQAVLADPDARRGLEAAAVARRVPADSLLSQSMDGAPVPQPAAMVVPEAPLGGAPPLSVGNIEPGGPRSAADFAWDKGLRFLPAGNGPYYWQGGKYHALARWDMRGICSVDKPGQSLAELLQQGLLAVMFWAYGSAPLGDSAEIQASFEVPKVAATYLVTLHLTDARGISRAAWAKPEDPAKPDWRAVAMLSYSGVEYHEATSGWPWLSLAPLGGEKGGYATVISLYADSGAIVLRVSPWLGWNRVAGADPPKAPALFGGFTVMRL